MLSGCVSHGTHVILLFGACALAGCKDGVPIVLNSDSLASPDARWTATLEQVDKGLGFGQGQAFFELHIHDPGTNVTSRCEESVSCVFQIEQTSHDKPSMAWTGPRLLTVTYQASTAPLRHVARYMDVQIEYRPIDAAPAG